MFFNYSQAPNTTELFKYYLVDVFSDRERDFILPTDNKNFFSLLYNLTNTAQFFIAHII